ncbi:MAG: site-specific integrase [Bacteroides sp.]|jgi:integrase|nr:site-specific integrase [Bacteroides sp.]
MKSLDAFVSLLVDDLALAGRHGTAHSYRSSVRRLIRFTGNTEFPFSALTPCFLKRYEQHLLLEGCKRNTVSLYLRMLRSICNQAVSRGIVQIPPGLFDDVFTGTDSSEKRAVSPSVIRHLHDADLSACPSLEVSRDCFLLSFYLRGIPFVDLIRLRKSDISKNVLRYRRSKTNRLLTVSVEPCAQAILRKYASQVKNSPYLLPIITKEGYAGYRQYQSALRRYNQHLGQLSALLGLKVKLTSYVARHSWATAAYHQGIPVSVISESLGHASEKVTYTYLASFDNRTLSRANRKVIALVTRDDVPYRKLFGKRNFSRWDL